MRIRRSASGVFGNGCGTPRYGTAYSRSQVRCSSSIRSGSNPGCAFHREHQIPGGQGVRPTRQHCLELCDRVDDSPRLARRVAIIVAKNFRVGRNFHGAAKRIEGIILAAQLLVGHCEVIQSCRIVWLELQRALQHFDHFDRSLLIVQRHRDVVVDLGIIRIDCQRLVVRFNCAAQSPLSTSTSPRLI